MAWYFAGIGRGFLTSLLFASTPWESRHGRTICFSSQWRRHCSELVGYRAGHVYLAGDRAASGVAERPAVSGPARPVHPVGRGPRPTLGASVPAGDTGRGVGASGAALPY